MIHTNDINIKLDAINPDIGTRLNKIRNEPGVRNWCRQAGLIDDFQQQEWLADISVRKDIRMYAIRCETAHSEFGDYVGICGLTSIDHLNQRAEFSCYVFPKFRLKGYCRAALIGLFRHGFDDLNLQTIWGETFDGNPAINLFQSIGMQLEGRRRNFYFKRGKFIDVFLLSMTREEFHNAHD